MACTHERAELIGELIAGQLDANAVQALLGHIEGCAECSVELDLAADLICRIQGQALPEERPAAPKASPRTRALLASALCLLALGGWWWISAGPTGVRHLAQLTPIPAPDVAQHEGAGDPEGWQAAMTCYAGGDYEQAIAGLLALRAAGDERPLLDLYLGIAAAQGREFTRARDYLTRADVKGLGLVQEQARWFRAQVYLASNSADDARLILGALARGEGAYAAEAAALLEQLE